MSTNPAYNMMINSVLFLRDMSRQQITQSVRQISTGLKENSGYAFRSRGLIPRNPATLDFQIEQTESALLAAREATAALLRTPHARALMELPVLDSMFAQMTQSVQGGLNGLTKERALLIDEVVAEPIQFSAEFRVNAESLRTKLIDLVRKHDLTPIPALTSEQLEVADLLVHGVALLIANVADEMSDLLFDRFMGDLGSGVYARPTRKEMHAVRDAMEARDAEIGEFLEELRQAEAETPEP